MASSASTPQLIFGCVLVGHKYNTQPEVKELAGQLSRHGIDHLDTAARYPPTAPGSSERLLGESGIGRQGSFRIDTKILWVPDGSGTLTEAAINTSLTRSLEALRIDKVNILYCHGPDKQTPIAEQAAAFDKFHKQGKFNYLGVSNFSIAMLQEWLDVSDSKGYVRPSYYQGQYSLICRTYESELFPFLKRNKIHFVGFSPLAAGFLTGKLTPTTEAHTLVGTRFEVGENNPFGAAGRRWYDKPAIHDAIAEMRRISEASGIAMPALALRWVRHHSALDGGDAILFGASSLGQVEASALTLDEGPLPASVVAQLEGLWPGIEEVAASIVSY